MTFSEKFAVVTEYKTRFTVVIDYKTRGPSKYSRTHAVLLADEHEDSPIIPWTYPIIKPEITPYKEIKSFLESAIPQNYDVYLCDGYDKYFKILEELKDRFTVKSIDDAPKELVGKILLYFAKVNKKADAKENMYINNMCENNGIKKINILAE
jgi:hypothetical protein